MQSLWLLLLFPLVWPFIAKLIWARDFSWAEVGVNIGVVVTLITGLFFLGHMAKTSDTEIWNGQITGKSRVHGQYTESYDCHCHTVSSGSGKNRSSRTVCQTCYREHYTVTWDLASTLGRIGVDREDWTSSGVYLLPNPKQYDIAFAGEPCSQEKSFTNYVKAVPESLFNTDKEAATKLYAKKIPNYPRVYGLYHLNRAINVDSAVPSAAMAELNGGLSNMLRTLGPSKQANIILIVTGIKDPSYRYAVEASWVGGKKNDIVVFIGTDNMNIVWTDVMTFGLNRGNELFHVQLRDSLKDIGVVDPTKILSVIQDNVSKTFTRIHMSKFEYLKDQIEPPTWLMTVLIIISTLGTVGLSFWFHRKNEQAWNHHFF